MVVEKSKIPLFDFCHYIKIVVFWSLYHKVLNFIIKIIQFLYFIKLIKSLSILYFLLFHHFLISFFQQKKIKQSISIYNISNLMVVEKSKIPLFKFLPSH